MSDPKHRGTPGRDWNALLPYLILGALVVTGLLAVLVTLR